MTKKELEQYRFIQLKIESLERRILALKKLRSETRNGIVIGSNPEFPYQEIHYHLEGYNVSEEEERREKLSRLIMELEDARTKATDAYIRTEEYIKSIKDEKLATIFAMIYIEGMTQSEVAEKLGYDRSTISKKIDGFLKDSHNSHSEDGTM